MTGLLDEEQARGWRDFVQTFGTVMRQLDQDMQADQGTPLAWFDVLVHLNEAPEGRLRMHELAETLVLVPSNLTRLFDRMNNGTGRESTVPRRPPGRLLCHHRGGQSHL